MANPFTLLKTPENAEQDQRAFAGWRANSANPFAEAHSDTAAQVDYQGVGSQQAQPYVGSATADQGQRSTKQEPVSTVNMPSPEASASNGVSRASAELERSVSPKTNGHHDGTPPPQPSSASLMPPPAAPASMLWNLRPSGRAKPEAGLITDPYIYARLVTTTVILFRHGKAEKARFIGQFTLDCIGQDAWDERLAAYLGRPPLQDDMAAVDILLTEAIIEMRRGFPEECGYLNGMLSVLG